MRLVTFSVVVLVVVAVVMVAVVLKRRHYDPCNVAGQKTLGSPALTTPGCYQP